MGTTARLDARGGGIGSCKIHPLFSKWLGCSYRSGSGPELRVAPSGRLSPGNPIAQAMSFFSTLRRALLANPRADILSGIVVALALIPEAIGFSIMAGVDFSVGFYASVSIAVIISLAGGRPGMISAATAAIAVLVLPLVRDHGIEYLFAATVLMGVIQMIAGLLRFNLLCSMSRAR